MNDLAQLLKDYPKESERKDILFNAFNDILKSIGFYINNDKASFERVKEDDKEFIVFSSNYGTVKQSITNDSVNAMFEDILKVLLKHCREMSGSKKVIDSYFESEF